MDALDQAVAVITGGSRGLGAAIARAFFQRGIKVGICGRSERPEEEVPREAGRVLYRSLDVREFDALDAFAHEVEQQLGPIGLWVNNAGILPPVGMARATDPRVFKTNIEINVVGVYNGSRVFLSRAHAFGRKGTLVNITSGAAAKPYRGWAAYCTSKAAVDHFTRTLALEESESGVNVFALAPGIVDTGMQELIRQQDPRDFPQVERFVELRKSNAYTPPEATAAVLARLAFGPAINVADPILDVRHLPEELSNLF